MKVRPSDCNHRLSKFVVANENDHAPAMPVYMKVHAPNRTFYLCCGQAGIQPGLPVAVIEKEMRIIMGEASDNGVEAINVDELMEIMDNDDELINECFHDFLEELPVLFKDLKSAVVNKNSSRLNSTAHRFKGTLKYLAAETAAATAYRLELAGKENDFVNVGQDLEKLLHECRQIELFIKNYKKI